MTTYKDYQETTTTFTTHHDESKLISTLMNENYEFPSNSDENMGVHEHPIASDSEQTSTSKIPIYEDESKL